MQKRRLLHVAIYLKFIFGVRYKGLPAGLYLQRGERREVEEEGKRRMPPPLAVLTRT
jgi:hypothetical protein